jgi:hypothetical protein
MVFIIRTHVMHSLLFLGLLLLAAANPIDQFSTTSAIQQPT